MIVFLAIQVKLESLKYQALGQVADIMESELLSTKDEISQMFKANLFWCWPCSLNQI